MDPETADYYANAFGQEFGDSSVPTASAPASSGDPGAASSGVNMGDMFKAGGSILGAFGSIMAGNEEQGADDYNAQLALEQGQFEVNDIEKAEADTLSTQHAMYAKAGVTFSGSPTDVAINTASQFEMDKQIANYNATSKANMDTYYGEVAQSKSNMAAATDLIQGGGQLAMAFA